MNADFSWVALRRNVVALGVLVVVLSLVTGGFRVAHLVQNHRAHERFVSATDPYLPLGRALAELPPPAGMTPAAENTDLRGAIVIGFRWQGISISPYRAARSFQQALRSVSATGVVGRCAPGKPVELCRVDAKLAGQPITVFLARDQGSGTDATVDPKTFLPPAGQWLTEKTF